MTKHRPRRSLVCYRILQIVDKITAVLGTCGAYSSHTINISSVISSHYYKHMTWHIGKYSTQKLYHSLTLRRINQRQRLSLDQLITSIIEIIKRIYLSSQHENASYIYNIAFHIVRRIRMLCNYSKRNDH